MARKKKWQRGCLGGPSRTGWSGWEPSLSTGGLRPGPREGWRGRQKGGARSCSSVGYPADMALREAHTCSDEHLHHSQGHRRSDVRGGSVIVRPASSSRLNSSPTSCKHLSVCSAGLDPGWRFAYVRGLRGTRNLTPPGRQPLRGH